MNEALSTVLKNAIAASGLSHAKLGEATGIPQPTISRFVGGADMKLSTADRLAGYFGLSLRTGKVGDRSMPEDRATRARKLRTRQPG